MQDYRKEEKEFYAKHDIKSEEELQEEEEAEAAAEGEAPKGKEGEAKATEDKKQ